MSVSLDKPYRGGILHTERSPTSWTSSGNYEEWLWQQWFMTAQLPHEQEQVPCRQWLSIRILSWYGKLGFFGGYRARNQWSDVGWAGHSSSELA